MYKKTLREKRNQEQENIEHDIKWLKEEISGFSKKERMKILNEYLRLVRESGIGIKEYSAFIEIIGEV